MSAKTIKSYKDNHKIISGISKIDYSRIKHKKLLNDEQVEYLKKIYQGISNRECTRLMNEKFNTSFSCQQIKAQKRNLHLISGLTGRFEKGSRPANPIQKGEHLSVETEFQKDILLKTGYLLVLKEKGRMDIFMSRYLIKEVSNILT